MYSCAHRPLPYFDLYEIHRVPVPSSAASPSLHKTGYRPPAAWICSGGVLPLAVCGMRAASTACCCCQTSQSDERTGCYRQRWAAARCFISMVVVVTGGRMGEMCDDQEYQTCLMAMP
jgi:hypothetical protein